MFLKLSKSYRKVILGRAIVVAFKGGEVGSLYYAPALQKLAPLVSRAIHPGLAGCARPAKGPALPEARGDPCLELAPPGPGGRKQPSACGEVCILGGLAPPAPQAWWPPGMVAATQGHAATQDSHLGASIGLTQLGSWADNFWTTFGQLFRTTFG